jgi:hypothetical protein
MSKSAVHTWRRRGNRCRDSKGSYQTCSSTSPKEAIAVIERAVREQGIPPGTLRLGTDNGSAFTARATRLALSGPRRLSPPRRLPRSREPSVHRELVPLPQRTLRLAPPVRDPRPGPGRDRRLHRPPPRPAPQPAQLPDTVRSPPDLGRRHRTTTKHRGLNRQHPQGSAPPVVADPVTAIQLCR